MQKNLHRKRSRRQRKNYNLQYFGPFEGRKWPLLANPEFHAEFHAFCMLWNTNVIMVGHGCSDHRMLLEHERYYGWAWMLWPPYAFGTRTLLWFGMDALVTVSLWNTHVNMVGHGCSRHRMLLEHERYYGWAWMLWSPYACGTRTLIWMLWSPYVCFWNTNVIVVGHGCSGHRMLLEHERYYGWTWMLWSPYACGTRTLLWLGMDALVTVCFWNTNVTMVVAWMLWSPRYYGWAWMLASPHAFGTRTLLRLGMDALVTVCFWNTQVILVGHGCSRHRMLLEHASYYGWAWMLASPYAFGTRTLLWLGMDALVTVCLWHTNVNLDALVTVCF